MPAGPSVSPYVILARFQVAADDCATFAEAMRHHAAHVRASGGALQFEFHVAWSMADQFMLYEEFSTEADWQAHQATPDTQAVLAVVRPLLAGTGVGGKRSAWQLLDAYRPSEASPGHATATQFRVWPGCLPALRDELRSDVASAAALCRSSLSRSVTDPDQMLICAHWLAREAWQAHQEHPAHSLFVSRTESLVDGIPEHTQWQPLQ